MGVTLERLPPERGDTAPATAAAGGCCCCCCCCLHTVGSVLGALTAKTPSVPESPVPAATVGGATLEPRYYVTKEYWVAVLLLAMFGLPLLLLALEGPSVFDEELAGWAIGYALVFPAIQLAASIVIGIKTAFSKRPGKDQRLSHLASITLRTFVGGLIGIVVMVPLFAAL